MSALAPVGVPERARVLIYGRDEIQRAVEKIPQVRIQDRGDQASVARLRMVFSPGTMQLTRTADPRWWGQASTVEHEWDPRDTRGRVDYGDGWLSDYRQVPESEYGGVFIRERARALSHNRSMKPSVVRSEIVRWSPNSRRLMLRRYSTLDYRPLFADDQRPALVTLTLPGKRWEDIAPDNKTFKKLIERFLRRYAYAWGEELAGIWKMEFQRRGAPHLHILMTPPTRRLKATGARFPEWLAGTWAELCKVPDWDGTNDEHVRIFRDHSMQGTSIDYEEGLHGWDPITVAAYFSKHGVFAAKDYQNEAPELWVEAGSIGRFWGYWRLGNGEFGIDLPDELLVDPGSGAESPRDTVTDAPAAGHNPSLSVLSQKGFEVQHIPFLTYA